MSDKCPMCKKEEGNYTFNQHAGDMYDMPRLIFNFEKLCEGCHNILCTAKSDLTTIAVQYHSNYHNYKNYKVFLESNMQMDDNRFYRSNPIYKKGVPVLVGNRRKEIEEIILNKQRNNMTKNDLETGIKINKEIDELNDILKNGGAEHQDYINIEISTNKMDISLTNDNTSTELLAEIYQAIRQKLMNKQVELIKELEEL